MNQIYSAAAAAGATGVEAEVAARRSFLQSLNIFACLARETDVGGSWQEGPGSWRYKSH